MKKQLGLSFALISAAATMSVQAEVLETTGIIGSICSFGDTTNGALAALPSLMGMSSEEANSGTPATITVTNNSPSAFAIFVSTPSAFSGSPTGYDGSEAVFSTQYVLAGISNNATASAALATAGTDVLSVSNSIDNGSNMFVAGAYALTNTVTCAAQ